MTQVEVTDTLGAFEVVARDGTLGGSVPLRAAQACAPLLEGNAFGLQVRAKQPLMLRRGLRGLSAPEEFVRACRGIAPILRTRAFLSEADAKRAALGVCRHDGSTWLFTGLFLRVAAPSARLAVLPSAACGSRALVVAEHWWPPHEVAQALFLRVELRRGVSAAYVEGDVATLGLFPAEPLPMRKASRAEADAMFRAHASFYDARYFDDKKRGKVTKKYKTLLRSPAVPEPEGALQLSVAHFGPTLLDASAPGVRVRPAFGFSARYDGGLVHVSATSADRSAFAEAVTAAAEPALAALGHEHPGARLYMSKYFTPHPAGEPYFFVKPPTLFRTPAGWSTVVLGSTFASADVLRGVVHTDRFHAVPQVFHVWSPFVDVRVRPSDVLCTLHAVPRELLTPALSRVPFAL